MASSMQCFRMPLCTGSWTQQVLQTRWREHCEAVDVLCSRWVDEAISVRSTQLLNPPFGNTRVRLYRLRATTSLHSASTHPCLKHMVSRSVMQFCSTVP